MTALPSLVVKEFINRPHWGWSGMIAGQVLTLA